MTFSQYLWVSEQIVLAIHDQLVAEHGGLPGIRDHGLLQSALAKPQNISHYDEQTDVAQLAAAYGYGLVKNHPFLDSNKRTAFVVMELFMVMNGYRLYANDAECVLTMVGVASGAISEDNLAIWLREHSKLLT